MKLLHCRWTCIAILLVVVASAGLVRRSMQDASRASKARDASGIDAQRVIERDTALCERLLGQTDLVMSARQTESRSGRQAPHIVWSIRAANRDESSAVTILRDVATGDLQYVSVCNPKPRPAIVTKPMTADAAVTASEDALYTLGLARNDTRYTLAQAPVMQQSDSAHTWRVTWKTQSRRTVVRLDVDTGMLVFLHRYRPSTVTD